MARRSDHTREELKKMILESAWKIAGREGFEGLTARRLAADIGYAPGTIYNVFRSMDDLYMQVNARTLDVLHNVLNGAACNDAGKSPAQNMKKMADLYMDFARECRPYWLMLFSYRLPEGRRPEPWYQEKINRLFDPLELLLRPLFLPRQDRKRKMAARVLWSAVHGLCILQETGKVDIVGGRPPADMAHYLIDTFVAGMRQDK